MSTTLLIESGIAPETAQRVMAEVNLCKQQDRDDAVNEAVLAHLEGGNVIAAVKKFKNSEEHNRRRCSLEGSLASSTFDAGEAVDSPVERLPVNERIRQRTDSREPIGRPRKMRMSNLVAKAYRVAAENDRKAAAGLAACA